MGPVLPALAIGATVGSTVLGAATSAAAARRQNEAIERSMQSQAQAAAVRQQELRDQASIEKLKALNEAQQIRGRLRVAAAEAGVGIGGSYTALLRQSAYDESLNQQIIDRNYRNQLARVRTGLEANLDTLSSQIQNPLLAAFTGGVSGLSTGLSIAGGLQSFSTLANTPEPDPYQPVLRPSI